MTDSIQGPRAGLMVVAPTLDGDIVEQAQTLAPWRGVASCVIETPLVSLIALGDAWAWRSDDLAVVLHGRIDRVGDQELRGHSREETTGLVTDALRRGATDFGAHVAGDFAAVVCHIASGTTTGIRSWSGARPLFWARGPTGAVAFASEFTQVALLTARHAIDEETVAAYTSYGDPAVTHTFLDGVRAVRPGRGLQIARDAVNEVGAPPTPDARRDFGRGAAAGRVRALLDLAVARRLRGATRPGAQLSGGMDSSAVLASAVAWCRTHGARDPHAFTLGFPEVPSVDEQDFARVTAGFLGVALTVAPVVAGDVAATCAERARIHGPMHPTTIMGWATLRAAAAANIDVVLTGQGGDGVADPVVSELDDCVAAGDVRGAVRWAGFYARRRPRAIAGMARREIRRRRGADAPACLLRDLADDWWTRMCSECDERIGAILGIRIEQPFLDLDLARFVAGLEPSVRWWPPATKALFREAMSDRLPRIVTARPDKTQFDAFLIAAGIDTEVNEVDGAAVHYADEWRKAWTSIG